MGSLTRIDFVSEWFNTAGRRFTITFSMMVQIYQLERRTSKKTATYTEQYQTYRRSGCETPRSIIRQVGFGLNSAWMTAVYRRLSMEALASYF